MNAMNSTKYFEYFLVFISINFYSFVSCNEINSVVPVQQGQILVISTVLYTDHISSFNNKDMDFRLDYYLRLQWNISNEFCEPYMKILSQAHIIINSSEQSKIQKKYYQKTAFITEDNFENKFWIPDTVLTNAKSVKKPSKSIATRVLKITNLEEEKCYLEYIEKMAAIVSCPMDLHKYPREIIVCTLQFRSYSKDLKKIVYKWDIKASATPLNPNLKLLRYNLTIDTNQTDKTNLEGKHSTVQAIFTFRRQITNKLFQVYLPSLLVVTMSWLSFWISTKTVGNGRITLLVMCLLAIISQLVSVRKNLPSLSYITLIDVWMLVCLVFIFGSIVEFSAVKYFESIHERHLEEPKQQIIQNYLKYSSNSKPNHTEVYITSPQISPLVPGYMQYLNDIINNPIKFGSNERSYPPIFGPNYLQIISNSFGIHENKSKSIEVQNMKVDVSDGNEVILFKIIDRTSRVLFPSAFTLFILIYSWVLFKIN